MAQVINTNIPSLNTQRHLNSSGGALATSLQRLSSGLRINSAKDDAAGLAISERMSAQINGQNQARRNANDGISLAQTAEGALTSSSEILQRIRTLAVQSANATNSASDRKALNDEVNALTSELNRIAQTTEFNGRKLLDGSFTSATFQVGANANQTITATSANFGTTAYGNYRIGSLPATTTGGPGDLTVGSIPGANLAQSDTGASVIGGGILSINGAYGTAEIDYDAGASAKDIVSKINAATESTGVTANARTEVNLTDFVPGSSYVLKLASNNGADQAQTLSFTIGTSGTGDDYADITKAFNDVSAKTGVTAKLNTEGNGVVLSNAEGSDIRLLNDSEAASVFTIEDVGGTPIATAVVGSDGTGAFDADENWITGHLVFDSDSSFSVTDDAGGPGGFLLANTSTASSLQAVSEMDVSTADASNRTLAMVDSALAAINSQRAKYGALQSRFENTIANLQISSENLSASRSRIRDTDFAAETADLTRAQILQQAGTAMLSQANALPQQVLQLLQG
ncbi:flagellin [Thauera linaloolentis]|uniref:Flagellin n=1 Tax=Thauera linaloolentis (strain DSM 12138 / JCM 21573 / CCUG 41526 / CIP 105981 / IAM 15112 / NBRC 102519 / 47Lol) TaxID=1123367 RepID=N6YWT5_THAL4|nr:flagellin [Thauera linaloolentis]ENO86862.1 flagellin [Thauera linaloolentis 47Lol = DSM 12138]MCM8565286.1 flagellin [Thauera linaloolentis]